MYASELISDLEQLVKRHGDLEVSITVSTHEYPASNVGYAAEGPVTNPAGTKEEDAPDRFVIEAQDDVGSG